MLDGIKNDFLLALRSLRRRPLATLYILLTLALGIGANTAAFSLFQAVLVRPLPYGQSQELVKIGQLQALPDILDWREQDQVFTDIGAFQARYYDYLSDGRPERLSAGLASASLLEILGVAPSSGRLFTAAEDRAGGERLVVLSERAWQRWLAGDPGSVGSTINLSGSPYTIIGIVPSSLLAPTYEPVDLWLPLSVEASWATTDRGAAVMNAYGRLRPGTDLERARADIETIASRLEAEHPETNKDRDVSLVPLAEALFGDSRPVLVLLIAAVALVLLIACANIANLLLARAIEERHEIAVRSALGASRWVLIREMLARGLVLTTLGGLVGFGLAWGLLRGFQALAPPDLRRVGEAALDGTALAFTLGIALVTCLFFGLLSGLFASRSRPAAHLVKGGALKAQSFGIRHALVISEVVLATVLLIGSGLLVRSFYRLTNVDLGYEPGQLLTLDLTLPTSRYYAIEPQTAFFREVFERVGALPGVESVGAVSQIPLGERAIDHTFYIENRVPAPRGEEPRASTRLVSPGYFPTMGIRLLAGRQFNDLDGTDAPLVAIINESMAREHWPNENPVGQRLRWIYGPQPQPWMTVVGVVGDIKQFGLDAQDGPAVYTPYTQKLRDWKRWMTLVVRSQLPPDSLIESVKREIWSVDGELPIAEVESMAAAVTTSVSTERFTLLLLACFTALAVLLAAGGIYAILSFLVVERRQEVGVRMALGARPPEVVRLFVRQGMSMVGLALLLGAGVALLLTRFMSALLFEVEATDPIAYILALLLLAAVAALACYLPARSAARLDPVRTLRSL